MLTRRSPANHVFAVVLSLQAVMACAGEDARPAMTQPLADVPSLAAAAVQALAIRSPTDGGVDTLVSFGGAVTMRASATDPSGRDVSSATVRWASGDTAVAIISEDGTMQVRGTGLVQLTATIGAVTASRAFPVVLIDSAAVREVLGDPLVARLVNGLSPIVAARARAALSASAAALAAGAAPTLRTLGGNIARTLEGADDPADRTVLSVLDLYVRQLRRALTLSNES